MAAPKRQVVGSLGAGAPILLNNNNVSPFNVGVAVTLSPAAALTYNVEHTYDDVFAPKFDPAAATWFVNPTYSAKSANQDGAYTAPVTAVRLNVTAYTSGSAVINVLQAF